jgi:O-acetylhomoserine (thiol)-lyase
MSAETVALLTLCRQGDHIVAANTLYGGTVSLLGVTFARFGIECSFVDPDDPEHFRAAMKPNTRAVFVETIANPRLNVIDLAAVAEVAHAHGVPLVVDNTLASPYLCRPIEHGADLVIHSVTKYLGGHGTTLGGAIVEKPIGVGGIGLIADIAEKPRGPAAAAALGTSLPKLVIEVIIPPALRLLFLR